MKGKWSGMGMVDGRGKINGTVASKNRNGAYLRVKVSGVNPQSVYQMAARALLTLLSQAWRSLTEVQRQAWNGAVGDFARTDVFGDSRNPTGKNLFTRLNINLVNAGQSQITSPPLPSGAGAVTCNGADIEPGAPTYEVAHSGSTAGHTIQVWATPPVSPGKSFLKGDYRLIGTFAGGSASPYNASPAYPIRFGAPAVDTKIGFRLVSVNNDTGETSTPSEFVTLAHA